jgi:ATP synthase F1 delta subunit/ATP synthase F0 subunit b
MYVLSKVAFPRIQEALDKRANAIRDSIEQAEKTREEAVKILEEYRARLREAREQADDIVARARRAAETTKSQAADEGREKREELLAAARRDIEAETRRSLERIRKEVADLTVLTTEKVTRKSLTGDDQKRLIDEALAEVDFSSLSGNGATEEAVAQGGPWRSRGATRLVMEEIARVYADALFGAARDRGKLDAVREQLARFADAQSENREMQRFFFSPYFSSAEKEEGLKKAVVDAEPKLLNFLELLIEKHRMPVLFRIRRHFDALWAKENKRLGVTVTSAVELDPEVARRIGSEIEEQTGNTVELQSRVDPDILGGLVVQVGNMVLDTSIRSRLEKLRKSVARAA